MKREGKGREKRRKRRRETGLPYEGT